MINNAKMPSLKDKITAQSVEETPAPEVESSEEGKPAKKIKSKKTNE